MRLQMELYLTMIAALAIVTIQLLYFNSFHIENGRIKKHHPPVTKNKLWIFAALLYAGGLGYLLFLIVNVLAEF